MGAIWKTANFWEFANLSNLYLVKSNVFDEKTVILRLLWVLESWERWQMNRQTCTLKVKKFELIRQHKIVSQSNFIEGGVKYTPPRDR